MKTRRLSLTQLCLMIIAIITLLETTAFTQSNNQQAIRLFNKGIQEKDARTKLDFYKKALELDPTFVEAKYNMGLTYKKLRDYIQAESYLLSARDAIKANSSRKLADRILYHLALSQKHLGQYAESEQSLLAANKVAGSTAMKSQIIFELGRTYHEMKRYPEALATLREGQKKFKSNSTFFQNLITIIETGRKTDQLELDIQKSIDAGDFALAQTLILQLQEISPYHAGLTEKKALIDSLINSKAKDGFLQEMFSTAEKQSDEGNIKSAISTLETILQNDTNNEAVHAKLEGLKTKYEEQQTKERAQREYDNGLKALQEQNWTRAIIAFEKVVELAPNFEDSEARLREANRKLESQGTETIVRQYYIDGVAAMNRKDLRSALASFEKASNLNPNYRDIKTLIKQLRRASQNNTMTSPSMASNEHFKSLYDQAVISVGEEEWMQAVLTLEKLRMLAPNDHNVLRLLIQAKDRLNMNKKSENTDSADNGFNKMVYVSGAVIALIALPMFGFVAFSATSRARLHYLRGNYIKAARVYERMLAKHPERLKYYGTLANIYLVLGRNDAQALRVFKMLVDLNLAKHIHPQINSILSQKYLSDGQHDNEAITILENELMVEQNNQESTDETA